MYLSDQGNWIIDFKVIAMLCTLRQNTEQTELVVIQPQDIGHICFHERIDENPCLRTLVCIEKEPSLLGNNKELDSD